MPIDSECFRNDFFNTHPQVILPRQSKCTSYAEAFDNKFIARDKSRTEYQIIVYKQLPLLSGRIADVNSINIKVDVGNNNNSG